MNALSDALNKLKSKDIRKYRETQLRKQNSICPLCGTRIKFDDAVLDHNHQNGEVRMVLHRQCNQVEGRVLSWITRTGKGVHPVEFLQNLLKYWDQDYSKNPLHPTHRTEQQKEILKCKKRIRTLKTEKAKQKYRDRIRQLQQCVPRH